MGKESETEQIKRLRTALKEIIALTKDQAGMPMTNIYFVAKSALADPSQIHKQGGKYLRDIISDPL